MLNQIKRASPLILGVVASLIIWWIVDSSQAFQAFIYESKNSAANDPLQEKISVFVREFWIYRRCLGAYVIDKNAAITALGTLAIAIFTAILGGFTISLSKSTRIAAIAAKESADAAVAAERARFFIVIDKTNLAAMTKTAIQMAATSEQSVPFPVEIKYLFKNYGKTPGIIREVSVGAIIAADPPDAPTVLAAEEFREFMIGQSGETELKSYFFDPRPTVAQAAAIRRNVLRVWFFGRLYYDDVFGEHQVHKFFFRSYQIDGKCILQPATTKNTTRAPRAPPCRRRE